MSKEKYELLIAEKPSAALKIAEALADAKIKKHSEEKVSYYEITHNHKKIIVAPAVGHLYGLKAIQKGWTYPVFEFEWQPTYKLSKVANFTKKYLDLLIRLSKDANDITVCTDYDLEGEVIGLNIVRFAAKRKDANRMKFSTLTKDEITESYENSSEHLIWSQAKAGETRHSLDWLVGINLSRALSLSIKRAGSFKIMSTGRIQGPTLSILSKREKEIRNFIPKPFWLIELITDKLNAWHKKDKLWDKKEAENIIGKTNNKIPIVNSIKTTTKPQPPPHPFDLTSLQLEAYKQLGFTPKQTLQLAQNLYIAGYISYPRTSSQKLPPSLNYKKILNKLSKQSKFEKLIKLLPERLIPREGSKIDAAHPAIYCTGEIGKLKPQEEKLYDLIVHRFLATFGSNAKRETMTVEIDVNKEIFVTSGTRTIEPGWHILYGKYVKFEEQELPKLKEKEELKNKGIKLHDKETQPPKRYNQASIVKELSKKNLGTKSTRASIVDSLYQRNYIQERAIEVTDLGLRTYDTLQKYVPEILDEKLTRQFEEKLEQIREGKKKQNTVLEEAKEFITSFSKHFKEKEAQIGKSLLEAYRETQIQSSLLGKCPNCENGLLNIRKGRFGLFISCDQYENCKTTFSIPKGTLIRPTKNICEHCKFPKILVIRNSKRPFETCLNKGCSSKENNIKLDETKKCPKCGGKLIIRKSMFSSFIGCGNYPKCTYTGNNNHKKEIKIEN